MKVKVTMESILETNEISEKGVRLAIERSAFNKLKDNLANLWALDEVLKYGNKKDITIELM